MHAEDANSIDDLLLQRARLDIQLRKRLRTLRDDPSTRLFTYVLLLQNNNVYVGSTNSLYMRLVDHLQEVDMSSKWVKLHGPVVRVLEVSRNSKAEDETYKTMEYMTLYGWESVRGSHWCKVDPRGPPNMLRDFHRTRSDFEYLSREEIDHAVSIADELARDLVTDIE